MHYAIDFCTQWPAIFRAKPGHWSLVIGEDGQDVIAVKAHGLVVPTFKLECTTESPKDVCSLFSDSLRRMADALIQATKSPSCDLTFDEQTRPNQCYVCVPRLPSLRREGSTWSLDCGMVALRQEMPHGRELPPFGVGLDSVPETDTGDAAQRVISVLLGI